MPPRLYKVLEITLWIAASFAMLLAVYAYLTRAH
jgi:hypothetical protein